ncbi:unnamed protein product [Moneuplotes crassus]|uniref:Exocyst complex component Sec6 n=1 Tax=Euplotes crassus TaxID=5936 RepID=A0AAD1X6I2_EUPCR|nr:unnamed protein product [Moneuplotes crassus]
MSAKNTKITKDERREITEFMPYLLSYSVDSLKHHQRNVEVQMDDLKNEFNKDLSSDIQHTISIIELYKKLSEDIPALRQANNDLADLMKELEKKCRFTKMNKLKEDKEIHTNSRLHLDDMLEIARLPTTINTLIHKNDSTMAMKLIKHFNEHIYDEESEILCLVKNEVDILAQKIHQKLNIEIEEGKETPNEIQLLLGDHPSEDEIQEYIHKKYNIKKDLLKQRIQKILFSKLLNKENKANIQIRECTEDIIKLFTTALEEAEHQVEEKALNFDNNIYKDLWVNSILKHFTEVLIVLIERLGQDSNNIIYLCDLKARVLEANPIVYGFIESHLFQHINDSSSAYAKAAAVKITKTINTSCFGTGKPKRRLKLIKEDFKEYTTEPKDLSKEFDQVVSKLEESMSTLAMTLEKDPDLLQKIITQMIRTFYNEYLEYFESKVITLGDFISQSEGILKFADCLNYAKERSQICFEVIPELAEHIQAEREKFSENSTQLLDIIIIKE